LIPTAIKRLPLLLQPRALALLSPPFFSSPYRSSALRGRLVVMGQPFFLLRTFLPDFTFPPFVPFLRRFFDSRFDRGRASLAYCLEQPPLGAFRDSVRHQVFRTPCIPFLLLHPTVFKKFSPFEMCFLRVYVRLSINFDPTSLRTHAIPAPPLHWACPPRGSFYVFLSKYVGSFLTP